MGSTSLSLPPHPHFGGDLRADPRVVRSARASAYRSDHTDHAASQLPSWVSLRSHLRKFESPCPVMRQPTPPGRDYQPDPFELQIGSMVVFHRATLLHHDRATHDALIQVANDYLWYGQYLEKLTGATPPWDASATNDVTPPLLFLETEDWIAYTQSIPKPSLWWGPSSLPPLMCTADVDKGRLSSNASDGSRAGRGRTGPTSRQALASPPCGSQRGRRRQGIATLLYDRIETLLDTKLKPSGWLSDDAYQFWQRRNPEFVQVAPQAPAPAWSVGQPEDAPQPTGHCPSEVDAGIEGGLPN